MTRPVKSLAARAVPPENEETPGVNPGAQTLALLVIASASAVPDAPWPITAIVFSRSAHPSQ